MIPANDVVIVSGLHALYPPKLRARLDLRIFIGAEEALRRHWKIARDVAERGHDADAVVASMDRRTPDGARYIAPQADHADLVFTLLPVDPQLLEGHHTLGENQVKLRVRLREGLYYEQLSRVLIGICGLSVEVEAIDQDATVVFVVDGEVAAEDIALAAGMLVPRLDELLDRAPFWHGCMAGIMQLVCLMQINQALRNGHGGDLRPGRYTLCLCPGARGGDGHRRGQGRRAPGSRARGLRRGSRARPKMRRRTCSARPPAHIAACYTLHWAIELLGMKSRPLTSLDLEQTYWRALLANARLFPDVEDFIRDLHGAGIATAVLTDLTAQIQFRKLVYFGLEGAFDYVVTSEEAGADKPDAAAFHLVLEKLAVAPDAVWLIGDNPASDIEGARRLGIPALQRLPTGTRIGEDDRAPDGTFESFGELRRLLGELVEEAGPDERQDGD